LDVWPGRENAASAEQENAYEAFRGFRSKVWVLRLIGRQGRPIFWARFVRFWGEQPSSAAKSGMLGTVSHISARSARLSTRLSIHHRPARPPAFAADSWR
jgi:hypothetical protein